VGLERGSRGLAAHARLLCGATALALLCALGATTAHAQDLVDAGSIDSSAQMLLEADTVIYDNDQQTVTAAGDVRIEYDGNRVVARRVVYNQRTGRIVAVGDVEIVDRDGNRFYSDEIDVTDDFKDGFINALRIQTVDDTYFAAESAERRAGLLTIFNNGVYTACEPCEDKPDKAPIWRVKSRTIIWNGEARTIRFESARFELFGLPIAYLPFFEMADPTVKRKSGFLQPSFGYNEERGLRVSVPYFFALSPTYDLTVTGHYYSRQSFLGEAEWRQAFDNGGYSLKAAGIIQQDPQAFEPQNVDSREKGRWMVGTKGAFRVNPRWTFGWDVLVQSDSNFAKTYGIAGFQQARRKDQVYLTGLNDRNFFDLRFAKYTVQDDVQNPAAQRDPRQPWVLPSLDYSYTPDEPVAGGELNLDVNLTVVNRSDPQVALLDDSDPASVFAIRGIEGTTARLTGEAEWKRNIVTDGGFVLTPLLALRGDAIGTDLSDQTVADYATMATNLSGPRPYTHDGQTYGTVADEVRSSFYRGMATAGLEARWPVLFSTTSATHVLEPVAQIFVRPDAAYGDTLSIPNEDAQSLVFDAANLFERDKFSGYDLIEGGTRANVGFRYSGDFGNGWTANAIFGQSYHIAGDNPYAQPNLVNAGAYSGLETDVSDFVGQVALNLPNRMTLAAGGRFDEESFAVRRAEVGATAEFSAVKLNASYAFIENQPLYGFDNLDRREVGFGATVQVAQNWRTFGNATYDLESETLVSSSLGFGYADECFTYTMAFRRTQNTVTREADYDIGFNISFRTIGDFGTSLAEVTPQD
jgi:LPS-assembly protein